MSNFSSHTESSFLFALKVIPFQQEAQAAATTKISIKEKRREEEEKAEQRHPNNIFLTLFSLTLSHLSFQFLAPNLTQSLFLFQLSTRHTDKTRSKSRIYTKESQVSTKRVISILFFRYLVYFYFYMFRRQRAHKLPFLHTTRVHKHYIKQTYTSIAKPSHEHLNTQNWKQKTFLS